MTTTGRRTGQWRRIIAPLALLAALVTSAPGPAAAEHHGNPAISSFLDCSRPVTPKHCVSVGNDSVHHVFIAPSVPNALAWAIRRSMRHDYGPTDLVMREQSEINARTDVIVRVGDYGRNGAAGWVWCPPTAPQGINDHGDRWCRRQRLYFNRNPAYAAFFADRASQNYMACHELGHTIGLRHWGNPPFSERPVAATCMNADVPNGPQNLHAWDIEEINRYYARP